MNITKYVFSLSFIFLTITFPNKRCGNFVNGVSYSFRYAIEAVGVITQHWEERRGDIVHGSYSFLEPTGKIRIVDYQVNGKHGFKAAVTYRNPPVRPLMGHLKFPKHYRNPIKLVNPVSFISEDLFKGRKTYPNLPSLKF